MSVTPPHLSSQIPSQLESNIFVARNDHTLRNCLSQQKQLPFETVTPDGVLDLQVLLEVPDNLREPSLEIFPHLPS